MAPIRIKLVQRSAIKVRALPRFPVNLEAVAPIIITEDGGTFTFSFDNDLVRQTLTAPAQGISVSTDASGNHVLSLANDLAAYEGLAATGMVARTGDGTAAARTLTGPAAGITVTNGNGVSGNPTLALANDLAALEGISATGLAARTADDTWLPRTITAGNGVSITNGNGVAGDPTIALSFPSNATAEAGTSVIDPMNPENTKEAIKDGLFFLRSETGAVARSAKQKFDDTYSITEFLSASYVAGTTDATAAVQAAIDGLPANGGTIIFPAHVFPMKWTSTVTLGNGSSTVISSKRNIRLIGPGGGAVQTEVGDTPDGPRIFWAGAAGGTMLSILGPIQGIEIKGLVFDCALVANTAIQNKHAFNCRFEDILVTRYRGRAIKLLAFFNHPGCATGSNQNYFEKVQCKHAGTGGIGIQVGELTATDVPLDVAQNCFMRCFFQFDSTTSGTSGIELAFTDNNAFFHCTTQGQGVATSDVWGLRIVPPPPDTNTPTETSFYNCPIQGNVNDPGSGWAPIHGIGFFPYPTLDGETIPAHGGCYGYTTDMKFFGGFAGIGAYAPMASAGTTDLGASRYTDINITGTTGITSFGSTARPGIIKALTFAGALTITHSASIDCPGQLNITTAANDRAIAIHHGSGSWSILSYVRASGEPLEVGTAYSSWTNYTPTITSGTGTITTAGATSGAYQKFGKTVRFRARAAITTNGTGATDVRISLPFAASPVRIHAITANDEGVPAVITGVINGAVSTGHALLYAASGGTYPGGDGKSFTIFGTYDMQ